MRYNCRYCDWIHEFSGKGMENILEHEKKHKKEMKEEWESI